LVLLALPGRAVLSYAKQQKRPLPNPSAKPAGSRSWRKPT
jgi:hypothetical protein